MALGAIEALKAEGYNTGDASKYIPVVGVDATAPALESMSKGELLGTVLNDAENQGIATVNVAVAAAQGLEITKDTVGYDVTDGKYIWSRMSRSLPTTIRTSCNLNHSDAFSLINGHS